MPIYTYKVKDEFGTAICGEKESVSEIELLNNLTSLGYFVLNIRTKNRSLWASIGQLGQKIQPVDLIIFTRQLATLLDAGIPINNSLAILSQQVENKLLARVGQKIKSDIESGLTLSEALKKHPKIFDSTYQAMVEAGETGGMVAESLEKLASLSEITHDRKTKVKSAITYPAILVLAAIFGIGFLVLFVFPLFAKIFSRAKIVLPLPTRILIFISTLVRENWIFILSGSLILFFVLTRYFKTKSGKWKFDSLKLKLPIFGNLFRKSSMSSFAHTFGALNRTGIPIVKSLEIVSKVVGNVVIRKAIEDARDKISQGQTISQPFKDSGQFPPMVVHMLSVGEESGKMDDMLKKVTEYYDRDLDYTISKLTTSLEPILIAGMGFVVAFMYLSLILPMFQLLKVIRAGGLG